MLIGREREVEELKTAYDSEYSQFIAVYGRRRVGKTFLVRETFHYHFTFQHSGIDQGTKSEQLVAFADSLKDAGLTLNVTPRNWLEAFGHLKDLIRGSNEAKKVIFIDELSWMDTHRSDLMKALENFWNGWASARKDIVLIICSSVTSWMIKKVIYHKGGLYHRLTLRLYLQPFSLAQCEEMAQAMNLGMRRFQILQAYMILGGVPFYWTFLKKGLSLAQNIDELFFSQEAVLGDEYHHLMDSLFKEPQDYVKIVQALAEHQYGMTREALLKATGLNGSGHFTDKLDELEKCGFIRVYEPFANKKKECLYQLIDCLAVFHYHFLSGRKKDPHFWSNQINTPRLNAWNGLAFERVCLMHIEQMKKALGIMGVLTNACSWICRKDPEKGIHGSQIDLLLERKDQVVNLMEMKYAAVPYVLTEKDWEALERKRNDLYAATGTTYAVHLTAVSPFGLENNSYAKDIQGVVTLDHLFQTV